VAVGGKCYRLLYRVGVKVTFLQAQNLCSFHGGLVAEIPSGEVYQAVFRYIRRTWSVDLDAKNRNFVQVFLNSPYEVNQYYLHFYLSISAQRKGGVLQLNKGGCFIAIKQTALDILFFLLAFFTLLFLP